MDANVRDGLKSERIKFWMGEREILNGVGLRLVNEGERAYARALRTAQEIPGAIEDARLVEHYYAPVPGDREGWCAVCGSESTFVKHRGSSSAAKDFIIGAFELYSQIMRYHGNLPRRAVSSSV